MHGVGARVGSVSFLARGRRDRNIPNQQFQGKQGRPSSSPAVRSISPDPPPAGVVEGEAAHHRRARDHHVRDVDRPVENAITCEYVKM
jgi:hypothetical protein